MQPNDELEPMEPSLKSLLNEEKRAPAMSAEVRTRMLARIAAGVGGTGAVVAAATQVAAGQAPAAAVATSTTATVVAGTATKIVIGVGIASFALGGAFGAAVHATVASPKTAPVVATQPATRTVEPAAVPPAPAPETNVAPPPAPTPEAVPEPVAPKRVVINKPAVVITKEPNADNGLGEERSLVEQARSALARHDAQGALRTLADHQARFPNGQLAEERMALQVLALVAAERMAEARDLATLFRLQFPNGIFRGSVDRAVSP